MTIARMVRMQGTPTVAHADAVVLGPRITPIVSSTA
jgi:hypothetical protein